MYLEHARKQGGMPTAPLDVRTKFMNTAHPIMEFQKSSLTSPIQKQGSGLIHVLSAIQSQTVVTPSYLALNSSDVNGGRAVARSLTIRNTGKTAVNYKLTHQGAASVLPFDPESGEVVSDPELRAAYATASIQPAEFSLLPGQSKRVQVRIEPPKVLPYQQYWLYSGFLVMTPGASHDKEDMFNIEAYPTITVPYAGMKGAYKKMDVMSKPESGYPAIYDGKTNNKMAGGVYSLKSADTPYVAIRLSKPCREVVVSVLDADQHDKTLGVVPGGVLTLQGRNDDGDNNSAVVFQWDGRYFPLEQGDGKQQDTHPTTKAVPTQGHYKLRVEAKRPFGVAASRGSYQTWTSPVITIDRSLSVPKDDDDENKPVLPAPPVNLEMNAWLRHALKVDRHGQLEGMALTMDQVLKERQHKADMSVLPVSSISFEKSNA